MTEKFISKILVPVDGSEQALKAMKYAIDIAKLTEANLTVLYVSTVPIYLTPPTEMGVPYVSYPALEQEEEKFAKSCLKDALKLAEEADLPVIQKIIRTGASVANAICEYAEKENYDLIIMGTRGRTGIRRLLLGSVAIGVVTYAPCPVLVVR